MRYPIVVLLLLVCCLNAYSNPVYDKLVSVNEYWTKQGDVSQLPYPEYKDRSDREWIKLHLQLVEQTLRARGTQHLNKNQKANRAAALDQLHTYWQAGAFPINDQYSERTPIFIDRYNNFCAVGYLVKATGHEDVSRMISTKTNLAYVKDMRYPELFAWAKDYGFTVDELAWIQPRYPSLGEGEKVGKGVNGVVYELFVDTSTQQLYVGGAFKNADSSILANNIAYVTETTGVYTWHSMGTGVYGTVNAITKYGDNVFVAGVIDSAGGAPVTNVAYWNDTAWSAAGCVHGIVRDLIVYKDSLYACGTFNTCSITSPGNFAVWNGTSWRAIPGLTGNVNTMELKDSSIYIGGGFNYNGSQANVVKWHPVTGFQTFSNHLKNEVMDMEVFYDTLYAVCRHTAFNDSILSSRLVGSLWDTSTHMAGFYPQTTTLAVNALCANADTFMMSGDFVKQGDTTNWVNVSGNFMTPSYIFMKMLKVEPAFYVDSTVYKMVKFKDKIVVGGAFITGSYKIRLNGICTQKSYYKTTPPPPVYPLNVSTSAVVRGCSNGTGSSVTGTYAGGVKPYKMLWSTGDTTYSLSNLPDGKYWFVVKDSMGTTDTATVTVSNIVLDVAVTQAGNTLTAHKVSSTGFHWVDCDNNYKQIDSANKRSFTPDKPGRYALVLTSDGCVDTSACFTVSFTDVKGLAINGVHIYPNPAGNEVTIDLGRVVPHTSINVVDVTGRSLLSQQADNSDKVRLQTSVLSPGIYTVIIKDEKGTSYHKLTKE